MAVDWEPRIEENITADWEPRVEEHYSRFGATSGITLQ